MFRSSVQAAKRFITGPSASKRPVYLDVQATTPLDPRVLDAMLPHMSGQWGNPHSRTHAHGWDAEKAVEEGRKRVATILGASSPKEVIFTSGATEANNLAIKGVAKYYAKSKGRHIITCRTEHKCILDSCRSLENEDPAWEVSYLKVDSNGLIDLKELESSIRGPEHANPTSLVSIMSVNNEIGVIQPIREIGAICRKKGVLFHTDAAQAVGKIDLDVQRDNIDLLSLSGHKIYGPKGIGALWVRKTGHPRVRLMAVQSGGGQERGWRSGTVPTALVVGLGEACRLSHLERESDNKHVSSLANHFTTQIMKRIPSVTKNGHMIKTYPGCVNMSFSHVEGESLLMALKKIALSSGSACTSASLEPSYVLRALGYDEASAHSSIRFGLGRFTTKEEVDFCIEECVKNVAKLRDMSPLWEMSQEGIDLSTIEWSQSDH